MYLNNQRGVAALGLFILIAGALLIGLFVGEKNGRQQKAPQSQHSTVK